MPRLSTPKRNGGLRPVTALGGLPLEQLMLLHRHWIWANRQRELFEAELVAGRPAAGQHGGERYERDVPLVCASMVGDRGRR